MGPLEVFFSQYPNFKYDPSESAPLEFDRLCTVEKMVIGQRKRHAAYMAFNHALTLQFNANYGTDAGSLNSWKLIARECGDDVRKVMNSVSVLGSNEIPEVYPSQHSLPRNTR